MKAKPDVVDQLIGEWRQVRPDLEPSPLEIVGRLLVLAQHLERSITADLLAHDLTLGQFDILATLRRNQAEGGLTPSELHKSVMLSSGGMTSRLDRLAERGLILRKPDPNDRRGVVVELTARGKRLIDEATETRFQNATVMMPTLEPSDKKRLASYLRAWLLQLSDASE